jgi:hypothetical protein
MAESLVRSAIEQALARYFLLRHCILVIGGDGGVQKLKDFLIARALHGNIEIGVRLSGAPASEARKIFSHLVESGLLEESRESGWP